MSDAPPMSSEGAGAAPEEESPEQHRIARRRSVAKEIFTVCPLRLFSFPISLLLACRLHHTLTTANAHAHIVREDVPRRPGVCRRCLCSPTHTLPLPSLAALNLRTRQQQQGCLRSLRDQAIIKPETVDAIFANVEEILGYSQRIVDLLTPIILDWDESCCVAKPIMTIVCTLLALRSLACASASSVLSPARDRRRRCWTRTRCTCATTARRWR